MVNYKFNQWYVSGEQTTEYSKLGYELLRQQVGTLTGDVLGEMLYRHFVKGQSPKQIQRALKQITTPAVKGLMKGKYSPKAYSVFMFMLETEPEVLDRMFGTRAGVAS